MSRATNNAGAPRHGFKLKLAFLVLLWPLTVKSELAVDEIYSPRVTAGDLEIGVVGAFLDSEGAKLTTFVPISGRWVTGYLNA